MVKDEREIARVATDYFTNLFAAQQQPTGAMLDTLQPRVIGSSAATFLAGPYIEDEVLNTPREMHPSKAPVSDGLSTGFYQKFWSQVKLEAVSFCLNVLNCGTSVQEVNQTNIVLIPKVKKPETMKQYRPISLCNVVYKIVSKTITIRLHNVLPDIISEEQSAL